MDFFTAEAAAHARTRRLLIAYGVAVASVVVAITWVVAIAYSFASSNIYSPQGYSDRVMAHPGVLVVTALAVLAITAIAAMHRISQLRSGGGAVAVAMGGVKITHETQDPKRQRLLHVVEELAIAAGVPVPEVYVLEQESGINAFAAGFAPADAAISVTHGALERLGRSELQGVIGHEFSHILNGDMRLNTRLIGPLFGLLVIAIVARYTLRSFRFGGRAWPIFGVAALIMALGYLGVLLGRLLQAAICRQREFLADASSVQFTRDPGCLRDALVRIGRSTTGSTLATHEGEDLAHLFIAPARERLFPTHPPLAARIRALDPRFDLSVLEVPDEIGASATEPVPRAVLRGGGAPSAPPMPSLSERVGNPGLDAVHYAAALRVALPPELEKALARSSTATCLWLAVALSSAPTVRVRQLEHIAATLGVDVARAVTALGGFLARTSVVQYLPLLQRALPVLHSLPDEQRRALVKLTAELGKVEGHVYALEFLLGALATRYLTDQVDPVVRPGSLALDACAAELGILFAVIARRGAPDATAARRAYERGLAALLPRERPEYLEPDDSSWPAQLTAALTRLRDLAPAGKDLLLDALGRTVLHDGLVQPEEAEMLRAVAALVRCPLPPLLPLAEIA